MADSATKGVLNYLAAGSFINRRFVAPGAECNTGRYEPHEIAIRDARRLDPAGMFDRMGFALLDTPGMADVLADPDAIETRYRDEVIHAVQAATGASFVVPMTGMVRSAAEDGEPNWQPPAADVHVDITPERAPILAERLLAGSAHAGRSWRRFMIMSFWRVLSAPPQDWPLALCDARSVRDDEGIPNVMAYVPELPEGDDRFAPLPDEASLPAASVFRFSPDHRWYHFPDMTTDEAVLLKFYDSDRRGAWRTPHTAFHDPAAQARAPRTSVEYRSVAYFA